MHNLEFNRRHDARFFDYLGEVRVLEGQLPLQLVVMLVEGAAGDDYAKGIVVHGRYCAPGRGRKSRIHTTKESLSNYSHNVPKLLI